MSSSSHPSPLSVATTTDSPDSLLFFYELLYEKAKSAAKISESKEAINPLISPRELAMTNTSSTYIGAVIATAWGLPIQQFWQKQGLYINKIEHGGSSPNSFYNALDIDDGDTIVSPNTEVLYSNAFLDLSNKVVTITYPTPETNEGIYTGIQVIDPYTNVQFSDGSAHQNKQDNNSHNIAKRTFYWAGASSRVTNQALAKDPDAIALTSPQAWVLGRINVDPYLNDSNKSDSDPTPYQELTQNQSQELAIDKIRRLNREFKAKVNYTGDITPTSNYSTSNVTNNETTTAIDFFTQLSNAVYNNSYKGQPLVFYSGTNTNGKLNPTGTLYNQQALFNTFGSGTHSIGLTAQSNSNQYSFPKGSNPEIINKGYKDALSAIDLISSSTNPPEEDHYWTINTTLGQYEPNYAGWITAAAVADVGLGANLASDGTYPQASKGIGKSSKHPEDLSSKYDYSITFTPEDSKLVPINQPGFWSVTVYDNDNFLIGTDEDNLNSFYLKNQFNPTTGVYSLGSNQFDYADNYGSENLTITLAPTSPKSIRTEQYWLPTPTKSSGNDQFNVILRLYNPTPTRTSGEEDASIFSKDSDQRWTPPFIQKIGTTTNGPLQFGRVHLDKGERVDDWSELDTVITDENGQYSLSTFADEGTLVFHGGTDTLTGQPYEGLLLADAESSVISPLTTLDWALQRNGHSAQSRDQIIDGIVNAAYEVLTGTMMNEHAKGLNSVTDTAPHQVIRSSMREAQDVAKSQAILNRTLGEALTDLWQHINERDLLEVNPLQKYKIAVMSLAREFETVGNLNSNSFRDADLAQALDIIQSGSGAAVRSLLSIETEMSDMDYYSLIELLGTEA